MSDKSEQTVEDGNAEVRREASVFQEVTLDKMAAGRHGKIVKISDKLRSRQKFADVGLVEGAEVSMEGHSPFGGLVRVKVMGAMMSFHREEAKQFTMRLED